MILDRTFSGILEQGKGHLVVYDSAAEDKSFTHGSEIISNMENVVAALFARAKNMTSKSEVTIDDKDKKEDKDSKDNDSKDKDSSGTAEEKKVAGHKKQ